MTLVSQSKRTAAAPQIDSFLASAVTKIPVREYVAKFDSLFPLIHRAGLTHSYRLAAAPLKKLLDETAVIIHFLKQAKVNYEFVQQQFGNDIPDAWLWTEEGRRIDVEITVAHAESRFYVMTELNHLGCGRGFVALSDGNPRQRFHQEMIQEQRAYSTEEYLDSVSASILSRIRAKIQSQRQGFLLIDTPISEEYIPQSVLSKLAAGLQAHMPVQGFEHIYLVGTDRLAKIK